MKCEPPKVVNIEFNYVLNGEVGDPIGATILPFNWY
jgi:hypothetical protein